MIKNGLNLITVLFVVFQIPAQQKTISGIISDESGLPLPDVNVSVKESYTGTQTNFDGEYKIIANVDDTLLFSYVGYITQDKAIKESNKMNVSMEVNLSEIEPTMGCNLGIERIKGEITYQYATVKFN